VGATFVEGTEVAPAKNYVGTRGSSALSQPRLKGSAFVEYTMGDHNIRATAHHVSSMYDVRSGTNLGSYAGFAIGAPGSTVAALTTYDLSYVATLPADVTLTAAVINATDEDPSFARNDLSYDSSIGLPAGRIVRVGASVKF
jgi:iron complex outermembrane receptor protein